LKGNDTPKSNTKNDFEENELALTNDGDDRNDTKVDEEQQSAHGSDEAHSSDKSKSSATESEDNSEDDGNLSLNGEIQVTAQSHPINVIEPEEPEEAIVIKKLKEENHFSANRFS